LHDLSIKNEVHSSGDKKSVNPINMNNPISNRLTKRFPQNKMLKNPTIGTLIIFCFFFLFMYIYKPLNAHESQIAGYTATMAIYSIACAIPVFALGKMIHSIKYFSKEEEWNLLKEFISIFIILLVMGTVVYFMAFVVEKPADRWNFSTFFDSCKNVFLIGVIPFIFFTILNIRYFRYHNISSVIEPVDSPDLESEFSEEIIQIDSKLKKEKLNFYPSQFLYAMSEGNYVEFYLNRDNHIQKEIIRNSISNIAGQLMGIPFCVRTHRAFIINVKTLGYRLKLTGIDVEIPVSRQNIKAFIQRFNEFN
jgi:hypothetical protein